MLHLAGCTSSDWAAPQTCISFPTKLPPRLQLLELRAGALEYGSKVFLGKKILSPAAVYIWRGLGGRRRRRRPCRLSHTIEEQKAEERRRRKGTIDGQSVSKARKSSKCVPCMVALTISSTLFLSAARGNTGFSSSCNQLINQMANQAMLV